MDDLTPNKVRKLSADDLEIPQGSVRRFSTELSSEPPPSDEAINANDPFLIQVLDALDMGFAGAILVGPPGTGKSWYAKRIASHIANGDPTAVCFVQFHPSYQYEDFMVGFTPNSVGAFEPALRIFPSLCSQAETSPEVTHVLVIDEISRCDAARIFGEALTYIETDKRGLPFTLASGIIMHVPSNLVILATMNPWDKGVDAVDIAFERRFAQIDLPPDPEQLRRLLAEEGADVDLIERVLRFFELLLAQPDETLRLGHAYFLTCTNLDRAQRTWKFRIKPFLERSCRLDPATFDSLQRAWTSEIGLLISSPQNPDESDRAAP